MKLREDSDPYCMLWIGILLLSAYYFNFLYFSSVLFTTYLPSSFILMILPILQVFFFVGYLRPDKGRTKTTMLSMAVIVTFFVVIFASAIPTELYGGFYLASWATGATLITAGGFSIMQSLEEGKTLDILDIRSLHYGSKPAELNDDNFKT